MKTVYTFLGDFYNEHSKINSVLQSLELDNVRLIDEKIENVIEVLDRKPDGIIIFKENRLNPKDIDDIYWLTQEIDRKLHDYVDGGGSLIAIHSALTSYPTDSLYVEMLRGKYIGQSNEVLPVKYSFTNAQATGYEDLIDYETSDIHCFVAVDDMTNVFLNSFSSYGEYPAGWFHEYGAGKIMCVVPSHTHEGLGHPDTAKLYVQAIKYCLSL